MNTKQSASQKIARIVAKHEDRTFYSHYTGRFMYGRACPGIVCSPYDVAKAITAVKRAITGKVTYCTDNMGLDMVVYFSGLMSDPVSGTVPQTVKEGAVRERARNLAKIYRNTEIQEMGAPVENANLILNPQLAMLHEQVTGEVTMVPMKKPIGRPFPFIAAKEQGEGTPSTAFPPAPPADPTFLAPPKPGPGSDKRARKEARKAKRAQQER